MNDETSKLLRELADKLGTTTEHLWIVLVRQATINAYTNLFLCTLIVVYLGVVVRLHIKFLNDENEWSYENKDMTVGGPMILAGFASVVTIVAFFSMFRSAVTGFLNPEFAALKYILEQL